MLERKIDYYSKVPIKARVCSIKESPVHFHGDDLEIVVALKGSVKIIVGYRTLILKEDEVFIFNDGELHCIYGMEEENTLLIVHLNMLYFRKYNPKAYRSVFLMAATYVNDERYDLPLEQLKEKLFQIAKADFLRNKSDEKFENMGKELLSFLLDNFQYFYFTTAGGKHFINRHDKKDNQGQADRVRELMLYIWDNYDKKITLQEYAKETNINMYYLSHIVKDSTGLNFQELLNFSRVEQSELLLLETNKKASEIALDCGFSATRYFVKHFRKWFQCDPDEYRIKNVSRIYKKNIETVFDNSDAMKAIEPFLSYRHVDTVKKSYFYTDVIEVDVQYEVRRKKTAYLPIMECNISNFDILKKLAGLESINQIAELCIRVESHESLNGRTLSFIERYEKSGLIFSYRDISYGEHMKIFKHMGSFCKRVTAKQLKVYIEYDGTVSAEEKERFTGNIKKASSNGRCKTAVRELMFKKAGYYQNNYIMDSMYIVPWIIRNAVRTNHDQKFINKLMDVTDDGSRMIKGDTGIITSNCIKKPSFYAYSFLSKLGKEVIKNSEGYIVTRKGYDIQVLFYDCDVNIFDNVREYADISKLELLQTENEKSKEYKLEFINMQGQYIASEIKIGRDMCLLQKVYDMGMPDVIGSDEEYLIRKYLVPSVNFHRFEAMGGKLSVDIQVPRYGATMILFRKKF